MSSRDEILTAVKRNQPPTNPLPDISAFNGDTTNQVEKFTQTLTTIGGKVIPVTSLAEVKDYFLNNADHSGRNITTIPSFTDSFELIQDAHIAPHELQNVDNALIKAHFGVAENGAVWVTEELMKIRVLPFICQHLAIILKAKTIVPTMHGAYQLIGNSDSGFGVFIAGPSKTADIEQSLVLGAHGARSLTLFLLLQD